MSKQLIDYPYNITNYSMTTDCLQSYNTLTVPL
jgi:hypothetical protein